MTKKSTRFRVATTLCSIAIGAALLVGCVDTDPPDWWDGKTGVATDSDGLTAQKEGQQCTAEEANPGADTLRIHFIDVGQGDAIWIQSPTGENVLIDAGDGGFYGRTDGATVIADYLTSHGFPRGSVFDAVVVTHAHSDHYGGMRPILGAFGAAAYVDPGHESEGYSYQDTVAEARAEVNPAAFYRPAIEANSGLVSERGQRVGLFGPSVNAWLLSAEHILRLGEDSNARVNNTSAVFRLSFGGRNVMLMADAHSDLELELVQRFATNTEEPKLDAHLLKVGHHGSTTSSSSRFLDAVYRNIPEGERYAIITSGRMSFGGTQLPEPAVVHALTRRMPDVNVFSTEAGDELKSESLAARDDNILAVIKADGSLSVCYH